MNVSLTGFMGCGKSSVGRILRTLLPDFDFIDLDGFIEDSEGKCISEIFEKEGEAGFREIEEDALETIFLIGEDSGRQRIVSLGGGTVTTRKCRNLVRSHSVCFYLRASSETLVTNLENDFRSRPMLKGGGGLKERIEGLMAERSPLYESIASHIIEMDGKTFTQAADEIIEALKKKA